MQARWLEPSVWALLAGALLAGVGLRAETPPMVSFERVRPGTLPPGFRTLSSVESEPGRWQVERVDGLFALGQVEQGRAGYRLAVLEVPRFENVRAGARLRVGGGDRAAGIAWRVRDAANYYAARLDFEDGEVVLYKFVRGNRVRLERLSGLRLNEREWHELAIDHVGDRVRVWLNGIPVASERDAALSSPGMVGLWLPGDSTAHFQRLWYEELPPDRDRTGSPENSKRSNDGGQAR
jgi:hypothetical protein